MMVVREKMDIDSLYATLRYGSGQVIHDKEFESSVRINPETTDVNNNFIHITFRNCTFKMGVSITGNLNRGCVEFDNCQFDGEFFCGHHLTLQILQIKNNCKLRLFHSANECNIQLFDIWNSTIEYNLNIDDFNYHLPAKEEGLKIDIVDTEIRGGIEIDNAQINYFDLKRSKINKDIKVNRSSIREVDLENTIASNILFTGINTFSIADDNREEEHPLKDAKKLHLSISKTEINQRLIISSTQSEEILLESITVRKHTIIRDNSENDLIIQHSEFFDKVNIKENTLRELRVSDLKSSFKPFEISKNNLAKLVLSESNFNSLIIDQQTSDSTSFLNISTDNGLIISDIDDSKNEIKKTTSIGKLLLNNIHGHCNVSHIKGELFDLSNSTLIENLHISMCDFQNYMIEGFLGDGKIVIESPLMTYKPKDNRFHLKRCSFQSGVFFNIDFEALFSDLVIEKSDIQALKLIEVKFPEKIKTDTEIGSITNSTLYQQLKTVYENQNNKPESLKYKSLEYRSYKQELKAKEYLNNLSDHFILWLNEWSNNHGMNPLKALLWILFLNLVFSFLFIFTICLQNSTSTNCIEYDFLNDKLSYVYFRTFNLTYLVDRLFPDNFCHQISGGNNMVKGGMIFFLTGLQRLSLGYLYFQFVSAFRKFVK